MTAAKTAAQQPELILPEAAALQGAAAKPAPSPISCVWNGTAFQPTQRFAAPCASAFVAGRLYPMVPVEPRSSETHKTYFAALNAAWANLPPDRADAFPSVEHLRKWALISAGFADERSIVCASKAEALRVAAFVKPMDPYAVVLVSGPVVKVYTAQSQSMRAMGQDEFQRSQAAVLEIVAGLIGVTPTELAKPGAA